MLTRIFFERKTISIFFVLSVFFLLLTIFYPFEAQAGVSLTNPLGGTSDVEGVAVFVGKIIQALLGLIGIISLLYMIIGGIYFLTSAGNPEKVKKGTSTIVWAVIGIIVAFSSYAILNFVLLNIGAGGEEAPKKTEVKKEEPPKTE